jgi:hypothetical protein
LAGLVLERELRKKFFHERNERGGVDRGRLERKVRKRDLVLGPSRQEQSA